MRTRHTEQPLAPDAGIGASEQDALELRSQLDELLRARQYAVQRERRLAEAVRSLTDRQSVDGELLRQLTQARTLREGLGARCLELSDRLKTVEEQLRQPSPRVGGGERPGAGAGTPDGIPDNAHDEVHHDLPHNVHHDLHRAPADGDPHPTPTGPAPSPGPTSAPGPAPAPAPAPPRHRSPGELAALAERITGLYRKASPTEAADILGQAAEHLTPEDTAALAARLSHRGPTDASLHLARSAVHGSPHHAAATLAELRRAGLADEAGDLFNALRSCPAADLPALLDGLERAGQHADGATLLWEWGSAPTAELAALATVLHRADRAADARTLLRQAAGRPTGDLTALATTLPTPLPALLLGELATLRPPAELVRLAGALAGRTDLYEALLTPLLADPGQHRTTLAALRTAGLPTTPANRPRSRWGRR
ncbi:hypothetical protein OG196_14820 [Kitasatospora purpeofusca]|uniref:hypothetical protein n=1 Tax=Kitasatospora purpeofusca TaxID=67352 RepID=UPI002E154D06|nr:hypothetical protein OG196_14820 [Kitasatospora purpeofusca]